MLPMAKAQSNLLPSQEEQPKESQASLVWEMPMEELQLQSTHQWEVDSKL
jgi:hypothetical protein